MAQADAAAETGVCNEDGAQGEERPDSLARLARGTLRNEWGRGAKFIEQYNSLYLLSTYYALGVSSWSAYTRVTIRIEFIHTVLRIVLSTYAFNDCELLVLLLFLDIRN